MDIDKFEKVEEVMMAVIVAIFGIIGIIGIIGFLVTWMWHCLLFAGMCAGMVWAWYYEDYKSKGKKLSTLWQKKSTKH